MWMFFASQYAGFFFRTALVPGTSWVMVNGPAPTGFWSNFSGVAAALGLAICRTR